MSKSRLDQALQAIGAECKRLGNSFKTYVGDNAAHFNGRPTNPAYLGTMHSFIVRKLLIKHPDASQEPLQQVYIKERDLVLVRAKEIDAIIHSDPSWTVGAPALDEKTLGGVLAVDVADKEKKSQNGSEVKDEVKVEGLVDRIIREYYLAHNRLVTMTFVELQQEHLTKRAKIAKGLTPEETKERDDNIRDCKSKMEDAQRGYQLMVQDNEKKFSQNALTTKFESMDKLVKKYQQLVDDAKLTPAERVKLVEQTHKSSEAVQLMNDTNALKTALKMHITQLHLWRWIETQLANQTTIKDMYGIAYNSSKKDLNTSLRELVTEILDVKKNPNPHMALFQLAHEFKTRSAITSFLRQRIAHQKKWGTKIFGTGFSWPFICPCTEFSGRITIALDKMHQGNISPTAKKATVPMSPRPENKREFLAPPLKAANTEAENSPPSTPRSVSKQAPSEIRIDVGLSNAQNKEKDGNASHSPTKLPTSSASPAKKSSIAFREELNKFEHEFNKKKKFPKFTNVCTINPLRWVVAALDGSGEAVMRVSSKNCLAKYTVGLIAAGGTVICAVPANAAVDLTCYPVGKLKKKMYECCWGKGNEVQPLVPTKVVTMKELKKFEAERERSRSRAASASRPTTPTIHGRSLNSPPTTPQAERRTLSAANPAQSTGVIPGSVPDLAAGDSSSPSSTNEGKCSTGNTLARLGEAPVVPRLEFPTEAVASVGAAQLDMFSRRLGRAEQREKNVSIHFALGALPPSFRPGKSSVA